MIETLFIDRTSEIRMGKQRDNATIRAQRARPSLGPSIFYLFRIVCHTLAKATGFLHW